jgi:hypothetical protein
MSRRTKRVNGWRHTYLSKAMEGDFGFGRTPLRPKGDYGLYGLDVISNLVYGMSHLMIQLAAILWKKNQC